MLGDHANNVHQNYRGNRVASPEGKKRSSFSFGLADPMLNAAGRTSNFTNEVSETSAPEDKDVTLVDTSALGAASMNSAIGAPPQEKDRSNRHLAEFNAAAILNPSSLARKEQKKIKGRKQAILQTKKSTQMFGGHSFTSGVGKVAGSEYFTGFCHLLVLANTVFIGAETDANMRLAIDEPLEREPMWCKTGNRIFTAMFCTELLVRLIAYGKKFFVGRENLWNYFDVLGYHCSCRGVALVL
jgi:hypothetical protein